MTPLHRHLHRAQWWLFRLLAAFAILMALVSSLTQLLVLPWLTSHPGAVSAKLGELLNRPVVIDRLDARWERTGPLLHLSGVHLGTPDGQAQGKALDLASAELKINFFAWARRGASWTEIRLTGIALDLVRDAQGQWQMHGVDLGANEDTQQDTDDSALFALGSVVVREARLNIDDTPNDKHFRLGAEELRLTVKGDLLRALGRVRNLQTDSAPVDAVVEYDRAHREGRAYFGGADVDLAAVLRNYPLGGLLVDHGGGKLQIWAWLKNGEIGEVRAEADLTGLVLTTRTPVALGDKHDVLPLVGIDRLAFGARWRREENGWSADVVDLAIERQGVNAEPAQFHLRRGDSAPDAAPGARATYSAAAAALDLNTISSAAMLADALPADLRRWLYAGDPSGTLTRAALRYAGANDFDLAARLDGFAAHASGAIPGVTGLSGLLLGDQEAITFDLPQHNAFALSLPKVFREPLGFDEWYGSIAAYRNGEAWRIETDALHFENATPGKSYGGEARGAAEFADAGGKPLLDVSALVTHADVPASHRFWPVDVLHPSVVEWLDRALDSGRVVGGRAVFRGNLADWPFRNQAGRFEAVAEVADLRFRYLGDWPALERGHAFATFLDTGLHAVIDEGSVQGVRISRGSVDITDFDEGTLDIALNAQGAGRDLLGYVKASPLGTSFAGPLRGVEVGGQGKVDFALHAPMKPIENFRIDGKVQLADADLADAQYGLRFDKASGPLRFDRTGFAADELAAVFKGRPAKFSLAVGGFTGDKNHAVEGSLDARLPASEVLAYAPTLGGYAKYLSGEANWSARFSADNDTAGAPKAADGGQRLSVTSDLRGVGIDLPAPLKKSADSALPLKLALGLPFPGANVDAALGDIVELRGRLPTLTAPFAANVIFGGDAGGALPKSGIAIGGAARAVDLSGWMSFANDGNGGGDDVLQGVDVRAASLLAWGHDLGETRVRLGIGADTLRVDFDGARVEGHLTVSRKNPGASTLDAAFKRLYWPELPEAPPGAPPVDDARNDALNPAAIPPLRIAIDDFRLGNANYGATETATTPTADGMRFDKIDAHSRDIDMNAHGVWTRKNGYHRSTFGIELHARDFGAMLNALGYGDKLAGGEIAASIDASWAGTPSAFALSKINGGALHMRIVDGRIPNLEPGGAGRLAGLLNLAALPRRLSFDFGDLFNKGFSFDLASGVFTMTDGYAYTEGFEVKSPAADMRIQGAIGLKTSEWNLRVEVTPHIGATVFAGGGALVGGPVGAAAGAVIGGVLGKVINQATQSEYKVTGTWDKPEIVKTGSRRVPKPDGKTPAVRN